MAEENDALKAQAKKDKEKIEKLEKEIELTNDLDVSLSMKLLLDSGIEESKMGKLSKKTASIGSCVTTINYFLLFLQMYYL